MQREVDGKKATASALLKRGLLVLGLVVAACGGGSGGSSEDAVLSTARTCFAQGKTASEAAAVLVERFDLDDKSLFVADTLKEVGYACTGVGQALRDVFAENAPSTASIMDAIGCGVTDTAMVLRDVYGQPGASAAEILLGLGRTVDETSLALRDVYSLGARETALVT